MAPRVPMKAARPLWRAAQAYAQDRCGQAAAALAYHAVFALPALLLVLMLVGSVAVDGSAMAQELRERLGPAGEPVVQWTIERRRRVLEGGRGILGLAAGLAALLLAATSATTQLADSLNQAWGVAPDPEGSWLRTQVTRRLLGLLAILATGGLLLVSLASGTLFTAVHQGLAPWLGAEATDLGVAAAASALSFLASACAVGALLYFLPDAEVDPADALHGGAFTAALFWIGSAVFASVLPRLDVTSLYGAAGSMALFLLWLYLSGGMLLFGAEFTQALATTRGRPIRPREGAVRAGFVRHRGEG